MRLPLAAALLLVAACSSTGDAPKPAVSSGPSAASTATASASATGSGEGTKSAAPAVREGGSIARAVEDDALFVADEDREVVRTLALPAEVKSKRADLKVAGRPAQVLVTRDRVLVTIRQLERGEAALLVLRRKPGLELEEVGRVSVPVDAWGMALTPDETTVLVTSAWSHRLTAIDLVKLAVRWSVDVGREPRGAVVLPGDDRAYVSHLVGSAVTRIDGIRGKEPAVKRVDLPASPLRSPWGTKLSASLGYSVAASPEGDRVYFPRHALGAMGPEGWFGAGTVDVLTTSDDAAAAPFRAAAPTARFVESINTQIANHEVWSIEGSGPAIELKHNFSSPRAVVYRKKTRTLLVVSEGTGGVRELDALAMDPSLVTVRGYGTTRKVHATLGVAEHGEAPSGIALSKDEDTAYVFCPITDDVIVIDLAPDGRSYRTAPHAAITLGGADEDKELRIGRALFHEAANGTMSGGLSCAGCHPEGRDDGHVWHEAKITLKPPATRGATPDEEHFTNFFATADVSAIRARWGEIAAEGEGGFGYARQTPMIAGRVKARGPYGWHGESPDLPSRVMAGFGLHRWGSSSDNATMQRAFANHLIKYLREGLVPPPRVERALTEQEERGRAIFRSPATKCATCHPPQTEYTDRTSIALKHVNPPRGFADDPNQLYKIPSLLFVGRSAPYMHDGRFESLESLIEYNQDRMGSTAQLSADEKTALIAFLRTL